MAARRAPRTVPRALTLPELERRCEARDFPLTGPRRVVLETLATLQGTHPTADEVYGAAHARGSDVGRATVYRTLETFVDLGILTKASHTGTAVRYDAILQRHHHLVCLRCDGIVDIADDQLDAVPVPDTSKLGFEVKDAQVQLRGLCRTCRELEEEEP